MKTQQYKYKYKAFLIPKKLDDEVIVNLNANFICWISLSNNSFLIVELNLEQASNFQLPDIYIENSSRICPQTRTARGIVKLMKRFVLQTNLVKYETNLSKIKSNDYLRFLSISDTLPISQVELYEPKTSNTDTDIDKDYLRFGQLGTKIRSNHRETNRETLTFDSIYKRFDELMVKELIEMYCIITPIEKRNISHFF